MRTDYFKDCKTQDDAKNLFRKLCHELHPDKGGQHASFIEMFNQFKAFRPHPDHTRENDKDFNPDAFYNTVMRFAGLENVLVSFVGSFIWLEDEPGHPGSTKEQKEEIKNIILAGYNRPRFSRKRAKWYYSPEGYKQSFRSTKTFEELKYTWGHKTFKPYEREQQAGQTNLALN